ncbi:hypothetical protein J1605_003651 [Eschrichtius robustus]|uniref:Uncharacterized protein n=1 Tax=Eschrichtius robustus TaxID=9764 RepID=A0AB34HN45_ESCRO|nr:hypothetical protein J1605_003651 [Eschrichtius robustus]
MRGAAAPPGGLCERGAGRGGAERGLAAAPPPAHSAPSRTDGTRSLCAREESGEGARRAVRTWGAGPRPEACAGVGPNREATPCKDRVQIRPRDLNRPAASRAASG